MSKKSDDKGFFSAEQIAGYLRDPAKSLTDEFDSGEAAADVEHGLVGMVRSGIVVTHGLLKEYGPGPVGQIADRAVDTDG